MKKELDVDSETDTERCLCGWTQRVVVNGSHSAWRPVSNSWSLLGLVLFNFCVDALKEEMESVLSMLSGDAKLMGPVDTGQGWVTTKGFQTVGIDELTAAWWNSTRTNALHMGKKSLLQCYRLGIERFWGSSVANVHSELWQQQGPRALWAVWAGVQQSKEKGYFPSLSTQITNTLLQFWAPNP